MVASARYPGPDWLILSSRWLILPSTPYAYFESVAYLLIVEVSMPASSSASGTEQVKDTKNRIRLRVLRAFVPS